MARDACSWPVAAPGRPQRASRPVTTRTATSAAATRNTPIRGRGTMPSSGGVGASCARWRSTSAASSSTFAYRSAGSRRRAAVQDGDAVLAHHGRECPGMELPVGDGGAPRSHEEHQGCSPGVDVRPVRRARRSPPTAPGLRTRSSPEGAVSTRSPRDEGAAESEVHQLQLAVAHPHDVVGLEIAKDDGRLLVVEEGQDAQEDPAHSKATRSLMAPVRATYCARSSH